VILITAARVPAVDAYNRLSGVADHETGQKKRVADAGRCDPVDRNAGGRVFAHPGYDGTARMLHGDAF
jgi:hypothetical protein